MPLIANNNNSGGRKVTVIKWAIIAAGVAIAAPAALLVLKGLVALLTAAVVGLGAIYLAPVVAMKFANQKVKMIVQEAQANPIETLINQLADKRRDAQRFADSITDFRTEVKNFEVKTVAFAKQYPEDAPRFQSQLDTMKQLLAFRESRYKQVQDELTKFANAIDRAKAMWEMSQAAQQMNKIAGRQASDTFEQIKTDAAVDSVMRSVNKAFSEMETSLLDNPEVKQAQAAAGAINPQATLDAQEKVRLPANGQ
jgi:predicted metal-dependent hydrolase